MASPDFSSDGMIALYPPLDVAQAIAVDGGLPPEEMHVTVAYLGDTADIDVDVLREVVAQLAERQPFTVQFAGHARFTGGDKDVIVALADSPDLEDLRRDTLDALRERGIEVPRDHGYTAHCTITYLDPDDEAPLTRLDAQPVEFTTLAAVHGSDRTDFTLEHPIAAPAREAFAAGWALSQGPMTERVKAASAAAVQTAIEHADDPRILEVAVDLGRLEGMWAKLFQRREEQQRQHTLLVATAWRALINRDAINATITTFRRHAGLTEAHDDTNPDHRQAAAIAAAATLNALPDAQGWHELRTKLRDAIAAGQAEGMVNAVAVAAEQAGRTGLDWNTAFDDAYQAVERLDAPGEHVATWLTRLVQRAETALTRVLQRSADNGDDAKAMADAAEDALTASEDDPEGSDVGFITDWAMTSAAALGAYAIYQSEGVVTADWVSVGDGRVCFPAGTPVRTPTGDRPIEDLAIGDLVLTPNGPRPVSNVWGRPYSGIVALVQAGESVVAATADHPFWTPEGWRTAAELREGDRVKTVEDVLVEVDRVHHLDFRQSDDRPSKFEQGGISARITVARSSVPVGPVYFHGYGEIDESEIDRPSRNTEFLLKTKTEAFKRLSDESFESVLAAESPVAGCRAELARSGATGDYPPRDAALATFHDDRRSPANFGTKLPIQVLLSSESLAAAGAVDVLGAGSFAGLRADVVPIGDATLDREALEADGTVPGYPVRSARVVAGATAVDPRGIPADLRIKGDAASLTDTNSVDQRSPVVTLPRTENSRTAEPTWTHEFFAAVMACVLERQFDTLSFSRVTGDEPIQVYDIEVAEEHVFYASGILVHNCSTCEAAEAGNPWALGDLPEWPAHPRCRCFVSASVNLDHFAAWFT